MGWETHEKMIRLALATRTKRGKPLTMPMYPGTLALIREVDPLAIVWLSAKEPGTVRIHHQQWGFVHSEAYLQFCRETGRSALH
jgi:hypothetical protein